MVSELEISLKASLGTALKVMDWLVSFKSKLLFREGDSYILGKAGLYDLVSIDW